VLVGWLWRGLVSHLLTAWLWQGSSPAGVCSSRISANKTGLGSLACLVASRTTIGSSLLLCFKPPWWRRMRESVRTGFFNKRVRRQIWAAANNFSFLTCRGGEGEGAAIALLARFGRCFSEAAKKKNSGMVHSSSLAVVEWHRLSPLMWRYPQGALQQGTLAGDVCLALASTGRTAALFDFGAPWRRLFNVRHRRPFSSSSTVQGVYLTPSGKIPGGKDDGLRSSFGISGDQGLDCVFLSYFRAPCAYVQDSFVISIFLRVLLVIWYVTVWN
jgi:hypothetical protein